MPKFSDRFLPKVPSYRLHKATGRGIVTLNGVDHYLPGKFASPRSREAYDRKIAEWLAAGRQAPVTEEKADELTISELIALYWRFAKGYYKSPDDVKAAMRPLKKLYGRSPATAFGPKQLRAVREHMIREHDCCRSYANGAVRKIKRLFAWGVEEELIPVKVHQALLRLSGLRKGKTSAREAPAIQPVDDATVQATLPHLPEVVADMVRFQRLTGCRPSEVCSLRPVDIDTSGVVWSYNPAEHKTAHRGRDRRIFIGPKGQDVLRPYLLRPAESPCFCPADSEKKRHREQRATRKTAVQPSQAKRRKKKPQRSPGNAYSVASYRRAIERAASKAGVLPWGPNRLRHSAASEVRKAFGLEAAQVVLGHSRADVTQIYAERDYALAEQVARVIG